MLQGNLPVDHDLCPAAGVRQIIRGGRHLALVLLLALLPGATARAQAPAAAGAAAADANPSATRVQEIHELRAELARLAARLDALERGESAASAQPLAPGGYPQPEAVATAAPLATTASAAPVAAAAQPAAPAAAVGVTSPAEGQPTKPSVASVIPTTLPGGATLNYTFDGYYEFNFNRPPGRINDLRAYDVLSNSFSISQATLMYELAPDLEAHRRFGLRLDLQYGQATDTLQGNPSNEARPDIYRNIFQAYGTYVAPVGKGLTLDFGKWASSLGVEGNYTKDQVNYTRSFLFYYLPFYHQGVRAGYQVNDKLKLNYWVVNGTNQAEPTNGYKDELFGFALSPAKRITWTSNYYLGQEHPDATQASNCVIPEQPGLCVAPISNAANGKTHIFDNYVTWQATPKLSLTGEGDYLIQRVWANAAPGESSAPSHVSAGAAYAQYQFTPHFSLGARSEYLSDRNGLFSNMSQALKEATGTAKYTVADGLDLFFEFRRDWTNQQYFRTHDANVLANHQSTATMGLVWWYGGKQGAW